MIEKLCPQPVKVNSSINRDSIAERRTAKLATKGRNVNLSPQKIQLPIKDISEGDLSSDNGSSVCDLKAGGATPHIVLSVSGPKPVSN